MKMDSEKKGDSNLVLEEDALNDDSELASDLHVEPSDDQENAFKNQDFKYRCDDQTMFNLSDTCLTDATQLESSGEEVTRNSYGEQGSNFNPQLPVDNLAALKSEKYCTEANKTSEILDASVIADGMDTSFNEKMLYVTSKLSAMTIDDLSHDSSCHDVSYNSDSSSCTVKETAVNDLSVTNESDVNFTTESCNNSLNIPHLLNEEFLNAKNNNSDFIGKNMYDSNECHADKRTVDLNNFKKLSYSEDLFSAMESVGQLHTNVQKNDDTFVSDDDTFVSCSHFNISRVPSLARCSFEKLDTKFWCSHIPVEKNYNENTVSSESQNIKKQTDEYDSSTCIEHIPSDHALRETNNNKANILSKVCEVKYDEYLNALYEEKLALKDFTDNTSIENKENCFELQPCSSVKDVPCVFDQENTTLSIKESFAGCSLVNSSQDVLLECQELVGTSLSNVFDLKDDSRQLTDNKNEKQQLSLQSADTHAECLIDDRIEKDIQEIFNAKEQIFDGTAFVPCEDFKSTIHQLTYQQSEKHHLPLPLANTYVECSINEQNDSIGKKSIVDDMTEKSNQEDKFFNAQKEVFAEASPVLSEDLENYNNQLTDKENEKQQLPLPFANTYAECSVGQQDYSPSRKRAVDNRVEKDIEEIKLFNVQEQTFAETSIVPCENFESDTRQLTNMENEKQYPFFLSSNTHAECPIEQQNDLSSRESTIDWAEKDIQKVEFFNAQVQTFVGTSLVPGEDFESDTHKLTKEENERQRLSLQPANTQVECLVEQQNDSQSRKSTDIMMEKGIQGDTFFNAREEAVTGTSSAPCEDFKNDICQLTDKKNKEQHLSLPSANTYIECSVGQQDGFLSRKSAIDNRAEKGIQETEFFNAEEQTFAETSIVSCKGFESDSYQLTNKENEKQCLSSLSENTQAECPIAEQNDSPEKKSAIDSTTETGIIEDDKFFNAQKVAFVGTSLVSFSPYKDVENNIQQLTVEEKENLHLSLQSADTHFESPIETQNDSPIRKNIVDNMSGKGIEEKFLNPQVEVFVPLESCDDFESNIHQLIDNEKEKQQLSLQSADTHAECLTDDRIEKDIQEIFNAKEQIFDGTAFVSCEEIVNFESAVHQLTNKESGKQHPPLPLANTYVECSINEQNDSTSRKSIVDDMTEKSNQEDKFFNAQKKVFAEVSPMLSEDLENYNNQLTDKESEKQQLPLPSANTCAECSVGQQDYSPSRKRAVDNRVEKNFEEIELFNVQEQAFAETAIVPCENFKSDTQLTKKDNIEQHMSLLSANTYVEYHIEEQNDFPIRKGASDSIDEKGVPEDGFFNALKEAFTRTFSMPCEDFESDINQMNNKENEDQHFSLSNPNSQAESVLKQQNNSSDTKSTIDNMTENSIQEVEFFNVQEQDFSRTSCVPYENFESDTCQELQGLKGCRLSVVASFDPLFTDLSSEKGKAIQDGNSADSSSVEDKSTFLPSSECVPSTEVEKDNFISVNTSSCSNNMDVSLIDKCVFARALELNKLHNEEKLITMERNHESEIKSSKDEIATLFDEKNKTEAAYSNLRNSISGVVGCINTLMVQENIQMSEAQKQKQKVLSEKNQTVEDLKSVEKAFSDLLGRYEKTKSLVEQMKQNEDAIKKQIEKTSSDIEDEKQKYNILVTRSEEEITSANMELIKVSKDTKAEIAAVTAMLRKCDIKVRSLTTNLKQATDECAELSRMCEEFGRMQNN